MSGETKALDAPLVLRAPRPSERAALIEMWVESWRATFPDIDFRARIPWLVAQLERLEQAGARTIGAFANAEIVGFVTIDPQTGWLDQLSVGPDLFGAGVGLALLNEAKKLVREKIALDVNADNFRARRFYEREGFVVTGEGVNAMSGRKTLSLEWRRES